VTAPYDLKQLDAARIETWRGDDLAILEYMPKWRGEAGDASRLVLDFKEGVAHAQAEAIDRCTRVFADYADSLHKLGLRYVVAVPRSQSNQSNLGSEAIAAALAGKNSWLKHAPGGLRRTKTVAKSRYVRQPIEVHLDSISYVGPALRLDPRGAVIQYTCQVCDKTFVDARWTERHVANDSRHAEAVSLWANGVSVMMIDDLITDGSTSGACRQILRGAGAGRVFGLFLARTYGR